MNDVEGVVYYVLVWIYCEGDVEVEGIVGSEFVELILVVCIVVIGVEIG